jgi:NADH:ubiquinone reductase (non-electrogenic)
MNAATVPRVIAHCKNVLNTGRISTAYQAAVACARDNSKRLSIFQDLVRARLASSSSAGAGNKPRVVVLGTGWSSFAFAKTLNHKYFDVHIVSPRNHMVFTPLLASTSVGTLEFRSIAEPVKNAMPTIHFTKGACTRIDTAAKTLTVETPELLAKGEGAGIIKTNVPYDLLVVGVGARNNTYVDHTQCAWCDL